MLKDEELLRYSRQIMLPELDIAGQEKLRSATVLVVGVGGLGSPVAMYLAAAGVGKLILVDHDQVDLSNLQRQIAHTTDRIGENKVASAQRTLQSLNPHCDVVALPVKLDEQNAAEWVSGCQVVVDCSDNFAVRFLLNRLSVKYRVPLVSGAAIRLDGQVSVYDPRNAASPCYRCLFDETGEEDLRCTTNGVLAPLVGLVGSIQATETIKVLCGLGQPLTGKLLIVDALTMQFRSVKLKKNPACEVCGAP
ncbi:MAG: molybdopterin-synthase adenylyltransferase MoeB [Ketobacter sp.]|nr:molybdopterin-synthase adenylyltransferase MoeB [Ketobacter sp.]